MASALRDFALEVHFSRWEFDARHNMTASDVESMRLSDLLALASDAEREAFETLHLGYTRTFGDDRLRTAIAGLYEAVEPEDVLCFAGAEEGLYAAMRVLLGPDDHAIVVTPNYQAAESVPLSICAASGVPLEIDRGWSLDIDRVKAAIRPNTRLVSINFPNNPTGRILPRADLDALVELCRDRGIWLFSDEVYRGIERDPSLRLPHVADVYERGLSLNVMSKAWGLPGLRIGWIACRDRAVLGRLERYKHYLSICNSGPSEVLARIALAASDDILARNRSLVRANAAAVGDFLAEFPELFDWSEPDGGCVGFVRYRGADGVEAFAHRLVEEAGVLVLPSSIYRSDLGPVPTDCFRVGFGRKGVPEGIAAMRAFLRRNGGS